jgi:hypothetical protein
MAGSTATAWVSVPKLPTPDSEGHVLVEHGVRSSTLLLPEQKCPCQNGAIFSTMGRRRAHAVDPPAEDGDNGSSSTRWRRATLLTAAPLRAPGRVENHLDGVSGIHAFQGLDIGLFALRCGAVSTR